MIKFVLSLGFVCFMLFEKRLPNSTDYKVGLIFGALTALAGSVLGNDLGTFIGWCVVNFGGLK